MRICCLSDLHGTTPSVPDCDLLLLGGDYQTGRSGVFEWRDTYKPWIDAIAARGIKVVGVAGNHDWMFIKEKDALIRADWTYLEDSGCEFGGLKIWGSPWQPRFCDWAFNLDEEDLEKKWRIIPDDTDILLLHGPPHGYGDLLPPQFCSLGRERTGSPSLTQRIREIAPKLVVCGHIHSGRGLYRLGDTVIVNVAAVDELYRPLKDPAVVLDV